MVCSATDLRCVVEVQRWSIAVFATSVLLSVIESRGGHRSEESALFADVVFNSWFKYEASVPRSRRVGRRRQAVSNRVGRSVHIRWDSGNPLGERTLRVDKITMKRWKKWFLSGWAWVEQWQEQHKSRVEPPTIVRNQFSTWMHHVLWALTLHWKCQQCQQWAIHSINS